MNLLDIAAIAAKFKIGESHAYALVKRPGFPPFVEVPNQKKDDTPRGRYFVRRWVEAEVDAYIAALPRGNAA